MKQENTYKKAYEGLVGVIEASGYFDSPNLISVIRTNQKYIDEMSELDKRQTELDETEAEEQEEKQKMDDAFAAINKKYE